MKGTLSVPERYREPLRQIANLTQENVDQLLKALDKAGTSREAQEAAFTELLDDSSAYDAVLSAAVLRSSHGMRARVAALEIADRLGDDVPADMLARVLEAPNVVLAAKVLDLSGTGSRVLHTSRIVTDVRPLFDDASEPSALGGLVVHTLIATTFSASGPEDIFITLDDEDLDILRDQLERALLKGKHVRDVLKGSTLRIVEEVDD